ncbi:MAG: DUF3047 domain-containing protein [Saprospiraceae bacterium]
MLFNQFNVSQPIQNEKYVVDNFNTNLTQNWKGRHANFEDIYQIKTENNKQFLSAKSINSDNLIVKKIEVDLVEYPYLNWKWRAHHLPENGNESVKQYCDAAASVAIILNTNRFFPKTIKYSWSTTLKKHSVTESPFAFWPAQCDVKIVQSGAENVGQWQTEKVNVLADYKKFYNLKEVDSKMVYAIVIMTDSDNTQTLSAADYDAVYFSKN